MTSRDRLVILIVAVIVAVGAVWVLVIQPKRDQADSLGSQVAAAQKQLDSARTETAAAEADRSTFARNYGAVAKLGEAVPSDDDTPSLVFQLQDAAHRAGVAFNSLVLSAASSTPAPATSTGSSTSQTVTATLPPGAAVGPAGLPTLPFTFTFQGNFFHLANLLSRLERFVVATNKSVAVRGRLISLNAISLAPSTSGFPQMTATISATTYLVPASQGLTDGASPAGPATGSSAQTAAGSTSSPAPAATITPTAP
jgi:type II secretory pathway pseudopilin PulG